MPSQIPTTIQDDEKLVRIIFSPYHVRMNKRTGEIKGIKNSAFNSIPDMDEVSVTRINYSTFDFCKKEGKGMAFGDKIYIGLAIVKYRSVIEARAKVKVTPTPNNPAHADIFYDFVKQRGEPYPAEINSIIDEIVSCTVFLQDENPESKNWEGQQLEELFNS